MSSTNNHQHSSPSVHRRGRRHSVDTEQQQQQQQQFGTICRDAVRNALPSIGQHSATAPTVQVRNQFQQLQLQSDAPRASSTQPITRADHAALMMNHSENEASAEDDLIERLKEIIIEFMTRPGRRHDYNTTMRWTVDYGNEINYSVVILINQPSALI